MQPTTFYQAFDSLLDDYDVIPNEDKRLHERKASAITDPTKRREAKIAHYKKEVSLKNEIQVYACSAHDTTASHNRIGPTC